MHHGFWDDGAKNIHQASLSENEFVAKKAKISVGKKILDAGCGVGGTAIYLAKKYGVTVTGITLNQAQVEEGNKNAQRNGVEEKVVIEQGDYTKTGFKNGTFDVVYAIESVSHSPTKTAFVKEAYRVLKPGGVLVVSDGYLKRIPKSRIEKKLMKEYCEAFALPEAVTVSYMTREIKKVGFKNVETVNKLKAVEPSVEYIYQKAKRLEFLLKLIKLLPASTFKRGVIRNYTASILEYEAHNRGLFDYAVHVGKK